MFSVKVGNYLNDAFTSTKGFRYGDSLSCNLFNIIIEKTLENAKVNRTGIFNITNNKLLSYANDINIVGRSERDETVAFWKIKRGPAKMDLIVNKDKKKIMVVTASKTPKKESK